MNLNDNIDFYGVFNFKSLDENDNVLDEYTEKNLIMDSARNNMAQLIGGVTSGNGASIGYAINRFVIGTKGHVGNDILDFQQVGETDTSKPVGHQTFDGARQSLFSEAIVGAPNYRITLDPTGDNDITVTADGQRYEGSNSVGAPETGNTVRRLVSGRTVTYTVTIPVDNANAATPLAYTEAALYAGSEIFSMKTFPARVKENTVKFEISWSIIF